MNTEGFSQYFNTPMVIILIGTALTALGGAWAAFQNNKAQVDLVNKTEKIAQLNEKISALVTGGDTFPYIRVDITIMDKNHFAFTLLSNGEAPLYDLTLSIYDQELAYETAETDLKRLKAEGKKMGLGSSKESIKKVDIGNLSPNQSRPVYDFMFPEKADERNFVVTIVARNGSFRQPIRIYRESDNFNIESEIQKDGKVLEKFVEKKRPSPFHLPKNEILIFNREK